MSTINDGGSAFAYGNHEQGGDAGMSLRDWFAGQAMAAIVIGNRADACVHNLGAAKDAYVIADYMLEARALEAEAKP